MKNVITTLLFISFIFISQYQGYGQNDIKLGYFYELTKKTKALELTEVTGLSTLSGRTDISILEFVADQPGVKTKGIRIELPQNALFKIIKKDSSGQLFVIKIFDDTDFENRLFGLTEFQVINYSRVYDGDKPKWSFVSTAVTIPIKIRPGDGKDGDDKKRYFDFEGNVNIGLTAGIRRRISTNGTSYLSLFGGISVGSSKLTTDNSLVTSETNVSTLTPFIGLMFEYNDFEIGLFTGWDYASGKIGQSWDYNALPWLGVGLGYNIFTTKNKNLKG